MVMDIAEPALGDRDGWLAPSRRPDEPQIHRDLSGEYDPPMTAHDGWPPDLDGVIAAPDHHRVLFENDRVRVIETIVKVGDTTPIHTHPRTVMYVVSGDQFVRRDDAGLVMADTREEGSDFEMPSVIWSEGTPPHVIENPGSADLVVIGVEIKS